MSVAAPDMPQPVRRALGSPVLFAIVQGFIAAALYFSLGLVAQRAGGLSWVVYLAAAVFFVFTALSYVEGASLHQERGGATVLARHAFNELWSFVAGWAILLDYLLLIALTGFVATDYLGAIFPPVADPLIEFVLATMLIGAVAVVNVRGIDPKRFERIAWVVIADLAVQLLFVALGVALLLEPEVLTDPASLGGSPGVNDLVFGFTLAVVAFTGLDASSGLAGQVAVGRRGLRRLLTARFIAVLVPYLGVAIVATSTLGREQGLLSGERSNIDAPLMGVVAAFEQEAVREGLRYLVAISALAVLGIACLTAMLGLSRLGYSLALNRQIPSSVGRLHPRYATPVVTIAVATVLAVILIAPADLEFLMGTYAFGATIAFTLVHLSVLRLRRTEPERDRPYKIPVNVRVAGTDWPVPALLGALLSMAAFVSVLATHGGARIVGTLWMALGITLYVVYRRSEGKSLYRRVTVPERTLTKPATPGVQYGSILVPVLGTPLDDDIMQTAGRLAAESRDDEGETGALIEAMWVFEVPMVLALDARLPDGELKRARIALAHAKAVGEEYEGVQVAPFTVRSRSAGQAIVREARRRGVEAIVLAAEEPTRIRGGMVLGGREGLRDTFVGDTTRYVIDKAPCRVILTAPPAGEAGERDAVRP